MKKPQLRPIPAMTLRNAAPSSFNRRQLYLTVKQRKPAPRTMDIADTGKNVSSGRLGNALRNIGETQNAKYPSDTSVMRKASATKSRL